MLFMFVQQFRFMLLSLAALEAPLQLPLGDRGLYGQDCVFIANDWHAALVPVYLAAKYRPHGVYSNARSVLAIHNLRHQVRNEVMSWLMGTLHVAVVALLICM